MNKIYYQLYNVSWGQLSKIRRNKYANIADANSRLRGISEGDFVLLKFGDKKGGELVAVIKDKVVTWLIST